jgi:hypothetical protein
LYEPGPNEVSGDLDEYTGEMEMEVSDLELWITHFDSELEGYEMFREHVMRHFGEELKWFMSGMQKEEIVTGDSDSEDDDCRRLLRTRYGGWCLRYEPSQCTASLNHVTHHEYNSEDVNACSFECLPVL